VDRDGRHDPQSPHGGALLVLLPRHSGPDVRRTVVHADAIRGDAIMCGAKVVWIGPDMVQKEFAVLGSEGGGPGLEP